LPRSTYIEQVTSKAVKAHPQLASIQLGGRLSRGEEEVQLARAQRRLVHLRLINGGQLSNKRLGPPVCVIFEGWDASGKGGVIKRLVAPLDTRHVRVAQFSTPTSDELRHHFMWRFSPALPGWGGMAILDRSWYGRVLVERVEGLATDEQWRRAYKEISAYEQSLAVEGMVLVKLWLHISHDEQGNRFQARQDNPLKAWKLTEGDWRNREKRAEYEAAVNDMLASTDHADAPWDVIDAEQKRFGRVSALQTIVGRIEDGMRRWGIEPPPSTGAEYDDM
jgi:polyphosphate kinase 2 (PPK2 family)